MAKFYGRQPKGKPIMAGSIPHPSNEPSYIDMYKGCSIYSYKDSQEALRLVMFDKHNCVRHGMSEVCSIGSKALLEKMYNLELVREIG